MIEAELTCICRRIELPDLDLVMVRGQKVYMPYQQALASMDLHGARRNGAVAVRPLKRYNKKRAGSRDAKDIRPPPRQTPSLEVTPDRAALAQEMAGKIPKGLTREEVAAEVQSQLAGMEARILAALAAVQPQIVHMPGVAPEAPARPSGTVEPDAPMFIPSGLVAEDVKGAINAEKSESRGASLDDAAAALKAARKKRK